MSTGSNQVSPETQVTRKLVERLRKELEAEEILEIRPVGKNKYYVRYEQCEWADEEDGGCWETESYVTIKGKWIYEEIINTY